MLKIEFSGRFDRMYRDLVREGSPIKKEVVKRIFWFRKNPNDSRLHNHALTKKMKGKFAFSITDNIRIVYNSIQEHSAVNCGDELNADMSSSFGGKPRSLERGGCHEWLGKSTVRFLAVGTHNKVYKKV